MSTTYTAAEFTQLLGRMFELAVDPGRLENIFDIIEVIQNTAIKRNKEKAIKVIYDNAPGLEEQFQENYSPKHDLEELIQMPTNTLGFHYANHIYRNNLKFLPFVDEGKTDRYYFFSKRNRQIHDIMHVLTGFNTDHYGEIGLQGFYLGQAVVIYLYYLMIARLFHILFDEKVFEAQLYLETLTKGFQMGQKAEKVLGLRWEDMWLEDIETLRKRLGII